MGTLHEGLDGALCGTLDGECTRTLHEDAAQGVGWGWWGNAGGRRTRTLDGECRRTLHEDTAQGVG